MMVAGRRLDTVPPQAQPGLLSQLRPQRRLPDLHRAAALRQRRLEERPPGRHRLRQQPAEVEAK